MKFLCSLTFLTLVSSHYVKWYCPKGELFTKTGVIPHHTCKTKVPASECSGNIPCLLTDTSISEQFNSKHFGVDGSYTIEGDVNITLAYDMILINSLYKTSQIYAIKGTTYVTTDTRFIIKNLQIQLDSEDILRSSINIYYDVKVIYLLNVDCKLTSIIAKPSFKSNITLELVETDSDSDKDYHDFIRNHSFHIDNLFTDSMDSHIDNIGYFTHQSNSDIESYITSFLGRIPNFNIGNDRVKIDSSGASHPLSNISLDSVKIITNYKYAILEPNERTISYGVYATDLHELFFREMIIDEPIFHEENKVSVSFNAKYEINPSIRAGVIHFFTGSGAIVTSSVYNLPIKTKNIFIHGYVGGEYSPNTGITTFKSELSGITDVDIDIDFHMGGWPNLVIREGYRFPEHIYPKARAIVNPIIDILTKKLPYEFVRILNSKLPLPGLNQDIVLL